MQKLHANYDKQAKIWSGAKFRPFYDYDCSLGNIIYVAMHNYPKNICQIFDIDGTVVTYEQALTWAVRIAQHFKKMDLQQTDVIGILARNTTYVMPVGVACLFNCTPFHAVNPELDEDTVAHVFGLTKPKVIFCDGQEYEKVYAATKSLKPIIYTLNDHIEDVPSVQDLLRPTQIEKFYVPENLQSGGNQTIAILCSSGTTGMPKAVCLSNYVYFFYNNFLTSEDIIYSPSGLDWYTGFFFFYLSTTKGCTRIITNKPYTPEHFVELVKKYRITYAIMAPRHVAALIKCPAANARDLRFLRNLTMCGGFISSTTLKALHEILKNCLFNMLYGFTEAGWLTADAGLQAAGSVGCLFPSIQARIIDSNGYNLDPCQVGEVCFNMSRHWNGYYGNTLETSHMFDEQLWFHSGDMGYFDEQHYLHIVDRKKDTLKYNGMHYWPNEIEEIIAELPYVLDVCVVGVYDECNGDAAGALVVQTKNSECLLSEVDIRKHVEMRFSASYKHLHAGVRFVENLPQNVNGKTVRKAAKELFMALKAKDEKHK